MEDERKREDEWFRANEKRLLEEARVARAKREAERSATLQESEMSRLREAHFMKCPKDGHDLKEEVLDGVKIDRCTLCEGIFFDAGELDQLFLKRDDDRKGFLKRLLKL